jgi:MFS family permease
MSAAKRAFRRAIGHSGDKPATTLVRWFGLHWFLSLMIGPLFGYYLTDLVGLADPDNWRTVLLVRAIACWIWPLLAALGLIISAYASGGGGHFTLGTAIGHLVVSSVCIYPALNAFRDLGTGPRAESMVLADKKTERSATRSSRFLLYKVTLSDGHSYDVERRTYEVAEIGDACIATRLPHTDMLLRLAPAHP